MAAPDSLRLAFARTALAITAPEALADPTTGDADVLSSPLAADGLEALDAAWAESGLAEVAGWLRHARDSDEPLTPDQAAEAIERLGGGAP